MQVIGFIGFVLLVTALIHLYLWKRLVRDTTRRGRGRRIGGILILTAAVLIPATMVATRATDAHWLAWPGYLWLATMFYLLVVLLALELPMLGGKLWLRSRARVATSIPAQVAVPASVPVTGEPTAPAASDGPPPPAGTPGEGDPQSRRLLLSRGAAIFAGLTAVSITGYGIRTALGPPQVIRVQIPLTKLDRRADGLRIALVSDIHLGPILGRAHTERIVSTINGLNPDLIAVVGDLVDGSVAELGPAAAPLAGLRARHGAFFVTGNHEYFSGFAEWVTEVDRLGLRPLRNERVEIVHGGGALDLAGVNDLTGGLYADGPDYGRALGGRDTSRPVVLLAHQPVQAREAARHGVDLQLSGHTHGGQIVPFNLLVGLQQPVISGLGTVDGTKVYVTDGAGFWGPPVRVGVPPEITLVELRAT